MSTHEAQPGVVQDRPSRRWWSLGLPVTVSLAVHGALATAALVVTWQLVTPTPGGAGEDVYLTLSPAAGLRMPTAEPVAPVEPPPSVAATSAARVRESSTGAKPVSRAPAGPTGAADPPIRRPAGLTGSAIPSGTMIGASAGVTFAGLEAQQARSVVYVVDASGPMVTSLPLVLAEVRRSVAALAPTQRFSVVLFRDPAMENGEGVAVDQSEPRTLVFEPRLVDATPRQVGRLADWLSQVTPRGRSNPLDGLRAAIALKPQVIFLLTRSIERSGGGQWELGRAKTLDELDRLNPVDPATGRRKIVIKTIQFLDHDPTGTMQSIAEAQGAGRGEPGYRVLTGEELRGR